MKKSILTFAATAMIFAACNNDPKPESTETAAPATEEAAPEAAATPAGETVEVAISGGDDMKFDKTEITVKEGSNVKLTLTHSGKAPAVAMGHNFVLLNQGVDLAAFAAAAIDAKDNDYIPKGKEGEVIAHTKTIGGGETAVVEFTAPAKGTYEFLCSFPGHSAMMKGHFIVE